MIHGHKKVKKQRSEQELKEESELSDKINKKLGEFFAIDRTNIDPGMSDKYLQFTSILMQLCSDIPSIFNFRRQLIDEAISHQTPEQVAKTLGKELKLSTKLMQSDPKCYTLWSYRQWLVLGLNKLGGEVVKAQKDLVKMLLAKDEKNFHAWNYRNWLNSVQLNIDDEIAFTRQKTKANPFNFSPYHFRSKFITQKYQQMLKETPNQDMVIYGMPKQVLDQELQTVRTAIFLNPNEEAPWLYYHWLLSQLVPAFVIKKDQVHDGWAITTNMRVGNYEGLIKGDHFTVVEEHGNISSTWKVTTPTPVLVRSNLENFVPVKLEASGRLFMGQEVNRKIINEIVKSIFLQQATFIDQVLSSEAMDDRVCRFGCLQQTSICKLILQCGTNEQEFKAIVKKGLKYIDQVEKEAKANKYIQKQLEYWRRLEKEELTPIESTLRSFFSE